VANHLPIGRGENIQRKSLTIVELRCFGPSYYSPSRGNWPDFPYSHCCHLSKNPLIYLYLMWTYGWVRERQWCLLFQLNVNRLRWQTGYVWPNGRWVVPLFCWCQPAAELKYLRALFTQCFSRVWLQIWGKVARSQLCALFAAWYRTGTNIARPGWKDYTAPGIQTFASRTLKSW